MSGLELVDCFDSDIKYIDVLIGLDHFYDFIDGEVIHGSTGPAAIKSKLDWLFAGKVDSISNSSLHIFSRLILEALPPREDFLTESQEIVNSLKQRSKNEPTGLHKGDFQDDVKDSDD